MPDTSKVGWLHMFAEQESSGLSISQYCKLYGISDKAFYNAKRRYKRTLEAPSLVAVEIKGCCYSRFYIYIWSIY